MPNSLLLFDFLTLDNVSPTVEDVLILTNVFSKFLELELQKTN